MLACVQSLFYASIFDDGRRLVANIPSHSNSNQYLGIGSILWETVSTMDQRQRDLLSSRAADLADVLDNEKLAELLHIRKLVDKQKVEDIVSKVKSRFCQNIRLLDALQESSSPTAFDDFVEMLEIMENMSALKIISPTAHERKQNDNANTRSIINKLAENYGFKKSAANSSSSQIKYPLGINSSSFSSLGSSSQSTSGSLSLQDEPSMSLFKGPKSSSVATSGASSLSPAVGRANAAARAPAVGYNGLRLTGLTVEGAPSTPTLSSTNHRRALVNSNSQTPPTRPHDLTLMTQNLTLSEDVDNDEPLVCWHPYAHLASTPHHCYPSYSSASSASSDSSSDSLVIDPNLILDANVTQAIAQGGPNLMKLKRATICHNNTEEDYKMTAHPRGPCLIVNNIDFENEIFPTRKGSDEDAKRFDDLYQQLGFKVIMRRNQTADQMRKIFKDVAALCRPEHDALFVFILSHGSEHGIYGTDGIEVCLESQIISCFDNRNCKAMIGKPKVFVIQACRGRSKDMGSDGDMLDSIACSPETPRTLNPSSTPTQVGSQNNRVPASWLPSQHPEGKKRKHPIRTDMLLVFSCLAGFVSVRNELAGSWLGVALAYFIMTHAHERDLLRILNLVTSDVIQRESSNGHIQSIELKLLGWTKNLYFNPGIYTD